MTDFFDRQDQARRKTRVLVIYFGLAVTLTILAVYLGLAPFFLQKRAVTNSWTWLWDPVLFASISGATFLVVGAGSLAKLAALRGGGGVVARELGGRPILPHPTHPDERKLLNVVEEMALASGTPVPELYVLPDEAGINAFAAGSTPQDAAIGVTRGCLQHLTRDELQGVIAHEFSHILNGDMRLNLRLISTVHGLLLLAIIGRILLQTGSRHRVRIGARSSGKGGNPLPLIGLVLIVVGSIGVFFGRLLKSAVSRQREFLADAAAVQFTRNPDGLAAALKKIGGLTQGSRLGHPKAEEASHLFFGNGLRESWFRLFATHPPLVDRIRALDPHFDGAFPRLTARASADDEDVPPVIGLQGEDRPARRGAWADAAPPRRPALRSRHVMRATGQPEPRHLQYATRFLERLAPELSQAARDPLPAVAGVLGLLLSERPDLRAEQRQALESQLPSEIGTEMGRLQPWLDRLERADKLPWVSLSLPALRQLSREQFDQFERALQYLVESDRAIDLFEYTLQRMVRRQLAPRFLPPARRTIQFYALKPLLPECTVLLSALAHQGHDDDRAAAAAFAAGADRLGPNAAAIPMLPPDGCTLPEIDVALQRLSEASPAVQRTVLNACAEAAASDGVIEAREAELLRAVAETLDCPVPPFLEAEPSAA